MSKDKRKKGCPNKKCINYHKVLFDPHIETCHACDSKLVFVCPKCFSKISDKGPDHVLCNRCEAKKKDNFDKVLEVGGTAVAAVGTVAVTVIKLGPKAIGAVPKALNTVSKIIR